MISHYADNTIKVYNSSTGCVVYSMVNRSFVSCIYKISETTFISGQKDGLIIEWEITYQEATKKNSASIIKIKPVRDIFSHFNSMISLIKYNKKHNILLTGDMNGNIFIRK